MPASQAADAAQAVAVMLAGTPRPGRQALPGPVPPEEQARLFAAVLDVAQDAVIVTEVQPWDLPGPRIVYSNPAFTRHTGWTAQEVLGRSPRFLQGPRTDPVELAKIRTALERRRPVQVELVNYRKDGTPFWIELSIAPLADETGWYTHWVSVQRDISERKQREQHTQAELGLAKSILASLPSQTAVLDADGTILMVNDAWKRFWLENGGPADSGHVGRNYLSVCDSADGPCAQDSLRTADGIRAVITGERVSYALDYECSSPIEQRWFHLQVVPLERPSGLGSGRNVLVSHSDITARKQGELALSYQATHDALTGLANRVQVLGRLAGMLAGSADPGNVALLFLDLDGFKSVNDSLGHHAGDEVLRVAANRLRAAAREQDLVGRLGGDEFLVCCPGVDVQQAVRIGARLADALRAPLQVHGIDLRLSVSTGVARGSRGSTADELLRDADVAMYRAKELGPGRVEVFAENLRGHARRRLDVAAGPRVTMGLPPDAVEPATTALFARAFRDANVGFALVAVNGTILEANRAFADLLGRSTDDLQGHSFAAFTYSDDVVLDNQLLGKLAAGEPGPFGFTKRFLHKDGSVVLARVTSSPLTDDLGDPLCLLTEVLDVTAETRRSSRLQAALDAVGQSVVLVDADNRIVLAGNEAERLLGGAIAGDVLAALRAAAYPDDRSGLGVWLNRLTTEHDAPQQLVVRIADIEGWRAVELKGHNLLRDPAVQAVVLNVRDVTEVHNATEQVRVTQRAYAVLAEANDALLQRATPRIVFERAFNLATQGGTFLMAWFGRVQDGQVIPDAVAGVGADYVRGLSIPIVESEPRARGPVGTAARLGQTISTPDIQGDPAMLPWHEPTERFGYRSCVSVPVKVYGEVRGVLSVYAGHTDAFTSDAIRLLERVAENLGRSWEQSAHDTNFPSPSRSTEDIDPAARSQRPRTAKRMTDPHTDQTTGLMNLRGALAWLQGALSGLQADQGLHLLLVDVDGFRRINQGYGDEVGDQVLTDVAERLRHVLTHGELVARLDSDKFVVGFVGDLDHDLVGDAQRIVEQFSSRMLVGGAPRSVSVSVGALVCDEPARSPQELLRDSRLALESAKNKGAGGVCLFDEAVRARSERRRLLERDLPNAAVRHELVVLYQPVIEIASGRVAGAEALVRWEHPDLGLVSPDEFIPLAEDTGDILDIGRFVIREAARTAALLRNGFNRPLHIAVNVSGRQFADLGLVQSIERAALQAGCHLSDLVVEVTETALAHDTKLAHDTLVELQAIGVRVAVDDFGTGYSSLSQLRQLPVDILKVDRSFVSGVPADAEDLAVVSAVINMATALGKVVVAEGIETEEQRVALLALGCQLAQGYFWARPGAADALLALIAREPDPDLT